MNASEILRVYLPTAATVHIAATGATQIDVGADGDVVWLENGFGPRAFRDRVVATLTTQGDGSVGYLWADGCAFSKLCRGSSLNSVAVQDH